MYRYVVEVGDVSYNDEWHSKNISLFEAKRLTTRVSWRGMNWEKTSSAFSISSSSIGSLSNKYDVRLLFHLCAYSKLIIILDVRWYIVFSCRFQSYSLLTWSSDDEIIKCCTIHQYPLLLFNTAVYYFVNRIKFDGFFFFFIQRHIFNRSLVNYYYYYWYRNS